MDVYTHTYLEWELHRRMHFQNSLNDKFSSWQKTVVFADMYVNSDRYYQLWIEITLMQEVSYGFCTFQSIIFKAGREEQITIWTPRWCQANLLLMKHNYGDFQMLNNDCHLHKLNLNSGTLNSQTFSCASMIAVRSISEGWVVLPVCMNSSNLSLPWTFQCIHGSKRKADYNLSTTIRLLSYYTTQIQWQSNANYKGYLEEVNPTALCVYGIRMTTMWLWQSIIEV